MKICTFVHEVFECHFELVALFTLLLLGIEIISIAHIASFAQFGRNFTNLVFISTKTASKLYLNVELDINVPLLANHDAVLQVEVDHHYHLLVTGLEDGMLHIGVQNINLVTALRSIAKTVRMGLQIS